MTDRHKLPQQVIHISNDAHDGLRRLAAATGKTLGVIVEELIADEVAQNGRTKELREKAAGLVRQ